MIDYILFKPNVATPRESKSQNYIIEKIIFKLTVVTPEGSKAYRTGSSFS